MKRIHNGIFICAIFPLLAAGIVLSSCSGSSNDPDNPGTVTAKSAAILPFISTLSDTPILSDDAEYRAVDSYISGLENVGFIFLDRADNAGVRNVQKLAYAHDKWTSFALNRMDQSGAFRGGYCMFEEPTRFVKAHASGDGAFMTGVASSLTGVVTRFDASGNVESAKTVSIDMKFYTARFDTQAQIDAFGGQSGTFSQVMSENKNFIALGTVKNDLFRKLQEAVTNVDSAFKVTEVYKGDTYTIYLMGGNRYWGLNGVSQKPIAQGINAYEVNLMWK